MDRLAPNNSHALLVDVALLEIGEMLVDHGFDFGFVPTFSVMGSKSTCAFPVISNASLVLANLVSRLRFRVQLAVLDLCSSATLVRLARPASTSTRFGRADGSTSSSSLIAHRPILCAAIQHCFPHRHNQCSSSARSTTDNRIPLVSHSTLTDRERHEFGFKRTDRCLGFHRLSVHYDCREQEE